MLDGNNHTWVWPRLGSTPLSESTDHETYDNLNIKYNESLVREAIQNSLDAVLDKTKPVNVRFSFSEGDFAGRSEFLSGAVATRETCGFRTPEEWRKNKVRWLTIEDTNTKGLLGKLDDRLGDYWGYWMNFSKSNKSGVGRGGRGIGRVSFLISSEIKAVLALTRRYERKGLATCGMTLVKAGKYGDLGLKSTHAYLAKREISELAIQQLYEEEDFHKNFQDAFKIIVGMNPRAV